MKYRSDSQHPQLFFANVLDPAREINHPTKILVWCPQLPSRSLYRRRFRSLVRTIDGFTMKGAWISTGLACLTLVEWSVGFLVGPSQCSRRVAPCTNRLPKSYPPRGSCVSLRTFSDNGSLSDGEDKEEALRTLTSEPGDYQQYNEEKEELISKLVTGAKHVLAVLEKDAKAYSMMKFNEDFLFKRTTAPEDDDESHLPPRPASPRELSAKYVARRW